MTSVLCILAAGRGSRLDALTEQTNKALLPVGNRAVLSHILEKFPVEMPVVLAVGYEATKVIEYCQAAHPDRAFTFVPVQPYAGPGSGPGYSLLCCREYLQQPFYLCTADCIVSDPVPDGSEDWLGVAETTDPASFFTVRLHGDTIVQTVNKSAQGYSQAFIGLAHIASYTTYWAELETNPAVGEVEFVSAFARPEAYPCLRARFFDWYDTGSVEGYRAAQKRFRAEPLGMEKCLPEWTYKDNGRVIKVCASADHHARRMQWQACLEGLPPRLTYAGAYTLAYDWIPGQTLYQGASQATRTAFFEWCQAQLWSKRHAWPEFEVDCLAFYREKTRARVARYLQERGQSHDTAQTLYGLDCQPIETYLERLDWAALSQGIPALFHGDLQFDNVLVEGENRFTLIDWRDGFGRVPGYGDLYYDLAKLYGGLVVCYDDLKAWEYGEGLTEEFLVGLLPLSQELEPIRRAFREWVPRHGYDLRRVEWLTALVWLGMAPLYVPKVGDRLMAQAKWWLETLFRGGRPGA